MRAPRTLQASISLVSCSWHHVFYSEPALWRYLELAAESLHRANEAGQVQQWCAAKAGLLRRVGTLVHHMSYTQQLWTERGDVYLDDKIPAAARGHDWQLSSSVLAHLSPAILQSLRFEAVECDPAAAEVLQRLTQLTSLYYDCSNALPAVSILLPLTRLRQLEWLERRQAAGVQQVDVQQLLARLPQLHSWCLGMSFGRRVRATMQVHLASGVSRDSGRGRAPFSKCFIRRLSSRVAGLEEYWNAAHACGATDVQLIDCSVCLAPSARLRAACCS